jgi:hypothetical protein
MRNRAVTWAPHDVVQSEATDWRMPRGDRQVIKRMHRVHDGGRCHGCWRWTDDSTLGIPTTCSPSRVKVSLNDPGVDRNPCQCDDRLDPCQPCRSKSFEATENLKFKWSTSKFKKDRFLNRSPSCRVLEPSTWLRSSYQSPKIVSSSQRLRTVYERLLLPAQVRNELGLGTDPALQKYFEAPRAVLQDEKKVAVAGSASSHLSTDIPHLHDNMPAAATASIATQPSRSRSTGASLMGETPVHEKA